MAKNDSLRTLENVLRVFRIIQTDRYVTRKRITDELGVHPRTVRRYLQTMERAGFHLDADEHGNIKPRVGFHPTSTARPPLSLITLTREELTWLYLLLSGVHHAAPQGMRDKLWRRIREALEGESLHEKRLVSMLSNFGKGYKSYEEEQPRQVIAALLEAMYRERVCTVQYQNPQKEEPSPHRVEPYQLFEFSGGLYCYARRLPEDGGDPTIMMLAVERITKLEPEEETFEKTPEVLAEISAKINRAFRITDQGDPVSFTVRFTKRAAPYATARKWHPSQSKPKKHPDGAVSLSFQATGRNEIVAWILGWGPACQVEAPQDLREEVKGELKQALEGYG